jgi:NAD(P)-dependent dehydrogenase (short-subunit alcohol dehydrogenase family)
MSVEERDQSIPQRGAQSEALDQEEGLALPAGLPEEPSVRTVREGHLPFPKRSFVYLLSWQSARATVKPNGQGRIARPMARLEGKVAVITGAGSGIGAAMAELFAREGARVIVADVSGNERAVAERLGDAAVPVHADVSRGDDVRAMLGVATSRFGRLDIICNNAGIEGDVVKTAECTEENFDRVWAVNGRAVFLGMHYGIPLLLANGGGSIINTASVASVVAFPRMAAYCAAKGAVLMMTKTAAAEYAAKGVRVNAVCPGAVETGMTESLGPLIVAVRERTPMGRMATPSEVASLALFLASDESSFITGAAMLVDGGYTAL